jgi:hypothetical protein
MKKLTMAASKGCRQGGAHITDEGRSLASIVISVILIQNDVSHCSGTCAPRIRSLSQLLFYRDPVPKRTSEHAGRL